MASEAIFTGEFENGNTSDLKKSTRIARDMITRYGMSDIGFGQIFDQNISHAHAPTSNTKW